MRDLLNQAKEIKNLYLGVVEEPNLRKENLKLHKIKVFYSGIKRSAKTIKDNLKNDYFSHIIFEFCIFYKLLMVFTDNRAILTNHHACLLNLYPLIFKKGYSFPYKSIKVS